MPRRGTLTGRVQKRTNRDNMRSLRNVIANRSNVNDTDILVDSFKCALNLIPRNFESYSCGSLSLCCSFCGAKHFHSEVTLRNTQAFTLCCHKGKVHLPSLSRNTFFESLRGTLFH